jgi:AraC-like DNA-binding protein
LAAGTILQTLDLWEYQRQTLTDRVTDVAGKKHDWQVIKDDYVQAPDEASRPTLEQLAAQYGCSPSYLREKAGREKWKLEAERYLQTVNNKRQEQKSTALAGDLAEWDANCFKMAQGGMSVIFTKLKIAHELARRVEQGQTDQADDLPTFKQLGELASALERFQKVGKTAMGEEDKLNIKIDFDNLSDEQLHRLSNGEDPRHVIAA